MKRSTRFAITMIAAWAAGSTTKPVKAWKITAAAAVAFTHTVFE